VGHGAYLAGAPAPSLRQTSRSAKIFLSGPRRPPRVLRVKCFLANRATVPAAPMSPDCPEKPVLQVPEYVS
jgi:hypothetical protein